MTGISDHQLRRPVDTSLDVVRNRPHVWILLVTDDCQSGNPERLQALECCWHRWLRDQSWISQLSAGALANKLPNSGCHASVRIHRRHKLLTEPETFRPGNVATPSCFEHRTET